VIGGTKAAPTTGRVSFGPALFALMSFFRDDSWRKVFFWNDSRREVFFSGRFLAERPFSRAIPDPTSRTEGGRDTA
jgi:hypothetical protein